MRRAARAWRSMLIGAGLAVLVLISGWMWAVGRAPGTGPEVVAAPTRGPIPAHSSGIPGWWHPTTGLTWQWQLSGTLDPTVDADVYDVDGQTTSAAQVADLHSRGRRVICYVNAGAYENFRPDANRYPASVLGKELDGWPGERWLDVRRWDVLEPILADRIATCRGKGFDGAEPDNVDGYANDSGFPLRAADQLAFLGRIADLAHRYGLAVGLKNDVDQAGDLVGTMDFAVDEECVKYQECDQLRVFIDAGKPVFHTEYDLDPARFCPSVRPLGFSSIRKHQDLDAWRQSC